VPALGTIMTMESGDRGDLRALDRAEGELQDIERALRRLDEGTYACARPAGGRSAKSVSHSHLSRGAARITRRRSCEHGGRT